MNDDGGVLGRLPRSRPGTRSEKRTGAGGPAKRTPKAGPRPAKKTAKATSAAKAPTAAKPPKAPKAPKAATPPRAPAPKPLPRERPQGRPAHSAPPPERGGDPVTDALRAGAKVAEGGAKLAGGLARELLRRLPRP